MTPTTYRNGLTDKMRGLALDDSIYVDKTMQDSCYVIARRIGIRIITRKHEGNVLRVWRVK